jgi:DNA repair exonuclease SbcCD ATPase subunit
VQSLKAKNLFSYHDIDLDFSGKAVILIEAEASSIMTTTQKSNGFGKSTIVEAISYALYGKFLRSLGVRIAPIDIITDGEKKMEVEVCLVKEEDQNVSIRIHRSLDQSGAKEVSMTVNGVERKFDKKKDMDKAIEEWLGIDFDMILRRFLTPENTSFISLSPSSRFKSIDSLMSFNWDRVYVDAANNIKTIKGVLDGAKKEMQSLEVEKARLEGEKNMLSYQENVRQQKLTDIEKKITELAVKCNDLKAILDPLVASCEEVEKTLEAVRKKYDTHRVLKDRVQQKVRDLQNADPEKDIRKRFNAVGNINCPHCKKDIGTEDLVQHMAADKKKEIADLLFALSEEVKTVCDAFDASEMLLRKSQTLLKEEEGKKSKAQNDFNIRKAELGILIKEKNAIAKEIANAQADARKLEETTARLADMGERRDTLKVEVTNYEKSHAAYQVVRNASQASSPARLNSVALLLPVLSYGVTTLISHLFSRSIPVAFEIQNDQLWVEAPALHIPTMSTGEKRSFDIAVSLTIQNLALQSSRNQIGFFIGDELFDGLDADRINLSIDLIKAQKIPQIILITHNDKARDVIEMIPEVHVLRVTNDNGISSARFAEVREEADDQRPQ